MTFSRSHDPSEKVDCIHVLVPPCERKGAVYVYINVVII